MGALYEYVAAVPGFPAQLPPFFFNDTATTEIYTLSLHDALPIGANVNGRLAVSTSVEARGFREYGSPYTMRFEASANDIIEVWMYSPNTPGYVAIDDVSLIK